MNRVRPIAWSGEAESDVAVFDDQVFARLEPDTAREVTLVREALRMVADSFGDNANKCLESISRRSPLSEWRLFVRGLVHWYHDRFDEAQDNWKRLDVQRRPSRISKALTASRLSNLKELTEAAKTSTVQQPVQQPQPLEATDATYDRELLAAATLVHSVRVARPAILEATRELSRRERVPAALAKIAVLGMERLEWILAFCSQYRQLEPQLVRALEEAALERAMKQPFVDVNQVAVAKIAGPPHDPDNLYALSVYHQRFESGMAQAEAFKSRYLSKSLPKNEKISAKLRAAIESEIHLEDARSEAYPDVGDSIFARMLAPSVDNKAVIKSYKLALKAYPANAEAHCEYVDWIREHLDDERLRKEVRATFELLIEPAMVAWAEGVPDEIEPRLWLVDHLLENERLEEAKPHVQWLAGSRHADPRVRATPWKWELLEAMRLCRRKAWFIDVQEKLDAAAQLWPSWLSRDWLPYFHAAFLLRQNKTTQYEQARNEIRQSRIASGRPVCELTDAVMMLAAAQHMRIPAADLKTLRSPVDAAVASLKKLEFNDLLQTASFFLDLYRTNLRYPAYRMHGGKFADELALRLQFRVKSADATPEQKSDFRAAIYWLSLRGAFSDAYEVQLPQSLESHGELALVAVAIVQCLLLKRKFVRAKLAKCTAQIDLLRQTAATETDPYYRYWFNSLAERATEEAANSSFNLNPFGSRSPFGWLDSEDDDEEDDEYEDDGVQSRDYDSFDPNCDCPSCTAARKRASSTPVVAPPPRLNPQLDLPFDPDIPNLPTTRIDPPVDPDFRRNRPKSPMDKNRKKNKR